MTVLTRRKSIRREEFFVQNVHDYSKLKKRREGRNRITEARLGES